MYLFTSTSFLSYYYQLKRLHHNIRKCLKMFAVLLLSYSSKMFKYKFSSLFKYVYTLITVTGLCAFSSNSSPKLFLQGELFTTFVLPSLSPQSQGSFSKGI